MIGEDFLLKYIDFDLACQGKNTKDFNGRGTVNFRAPELAS
eukprot:CAMPEP_0114587350 /NCGR_PEP_ID=MMETSP0125-20121206/10326_1 /TAXON_ID=485358 ORGANISM="Aristerostoma sp., Strain ATCC 50986" /NCGR_SAMPLE_ID=MMETSP0125 /ASSEMBLY_ACC=CAM_ASM_000245 /LENGTH=40 /DNA_ID= /DNA_START= /DNA_END= /DNA_ORIENTATION=